MILRQLELLILKLSKPYTTYKKGSDMNIRGLLAGIILFAILVTLNEGRNAQRDTNDIIVEEGDLSVFSIAVGDCLSLPDNETQFSSITATPCQEAHDAEVFHEFNILVEEYDGNYIATLSEERCLENFERYVGLPFVESIYYISNFSPTPESWSQVGDRTVQCLIVGDGTTRLMGSARGARE